MTYPSVVLGQSGLLAFWRMGDATGVMVDSSGNSHDGTHRASVQLNQTQLQTSDADPAVDYPANNANSESDVGFGSWMNVSAWTVSMLINPDVLTGTRFLIQHDEDASPASELHWRFVLESGHLRAYGIFNGSLVIVDGATTLSTGVIYHVAFTYDGANIKVWLNGVQDGSTAATVPNVSSTKGIWIGQWANFGSNYYDGRMDEVAYFDRALSGAELLAQVAAMAPGPVDYNVGIGDAESDATALGASAESGQATGSGQSDAVAVSTTVYGTARNRVGGRRRSGIGYATYEPPVTPVPIPYTAERGWDAAQAFAAPVISPSGRPVYTPTIKTKRRQRHRISVGGVDVTYFRDVPTPFPGFQLEEPLMYGAISLTFPQIAAPYERIGVGALSWLHPGAEVLIQRVNVDTDAVEARDYRGVVVDFDVTGPTLMVTVGGEAMGRMALVNRQVPIWTSWQDIGRYAYSAFKEVNLRLAPYLGPTTGIRLQRFGGQTVLDYVNELLSRAWNRAGNQWTIMPVGPGKYRMARKDTDTIDGTVYNDDTRTVANLHRAISEEPNRIFGTGVTPAGMRVRNAVYPGLVQGPPAPYPMDDNSTFGVGTTDGDTDTGDGITLMVNRLIIMKYLDQENHPNGYTDATEAAIRDLQEDAGMTFTSGVMDPATWRALYDLDVTGYSLRWSHIEPMAQRSRVRRWNRSGSGGVTGRNINFDPAALIVDRNIDFGSGFTSDQMKEWARAELGPEDNWTGTIVFGLGGLIVGEHTPGDPITEADVMRARDLRPGMNLRLPHFDGGITVHVASVDVAADGLVTAAVDTRARDAMKVWEVISRNRETRKNPSRFHIAHHRTSTTTQDSMGVWDEVGGLLNNDVVVPAETWVVFPLVAGQEGTVRSLRMQTTPEAEYVVAVFGDTIYPARLASLVGNPLTKAGSKKFAKESVRSQLDVVNLMLYVAGSWEQPCGYFPGTKIDEDDEGGNYPLNGRWEDDASYSYHTGRNPVLYVAVFADRDTVIPAGQIMRNQLEAGV